MGTYVEGPKDTKTQGKDINHKVRPYSTLSDPTNRTEKTIPRFKDVYISRFQDFKISRFQRIQELE